MIACVGPQLMFRRLPSGVLSMKFAKVSNFEMILESNQAASEASAASILLGVTSSV